MVVTDTILVERRGTDRLDAANETLLDERVQGVVDGLPRDCADLLLGPFHDVFGRGVWGASNCAHHGQALSGDVHAEIFEDVMRGHEFRLDQVLD